MKFALSHHAKIQDCKLKVRNIDKWRDTLLTLNNQDVIITIEKEKDYRTIPMNRLYWLFLGVIENETGMNANDIHEIAKRKFLPPRFVKFKDEEIKLPATTTKLDKKEFSEYLDKISIWTDIPIPNLEV